jgi:glycosyltransferase involved in cell wall biosynthesis
VVQKLRVGLGATVLARGLASNGHLDGIGIYTRELVNALSQDGSEFEVSPVVFGNSLTLPQQVAVRKFPLSFEVSSAAAYLGRVSTPGARGVLQGLDLLHAPDHCIPRIRHIPLIASIMDVIPLTQPEYVRSSLQQLKSAAFSYLAKQAQHIITISDYSAQEIEQVLGIPKERISVTPLAVSAKFFEHASEVQKLEVLKKYALNKPYFLFVGTLQTRKNVGRIVDAYERLPFDIRTSFDLVVAGRSRPDMTDLVQRLTAAQQTGSVKWIQYVPDADLPLLLQAARALVFPSLYEGFGLPVLEAFASSTPVITSNTTSLPEVAGDAAWLVNPLAVEEISAAMEQLTHSSDVIEQKVEQGYERAKQFTWQRTAELTAKVYKSFRP